MEMFQELLEQFLSALDRAHGNLARPNSTFYSLSLVTESMSWLRSQVGKGRMLNRKGERFAAGAACYLAWLTDQSYGRRGLKRSMLSEWNPERPETGIFLVAQRERNGQTEKYEQDYCRDLHQFLLRPPEPFPITNDVMTSITSLSLIPPEYLFML
jgi:hypothetical protein